MKYLLILLLSSLLGLSSIAQHQITGTVQDAKTQIPLAFANIVILPKYTGTVSNIEGKFIVNLSQISEADSVLFSHVGYENLKISAQSMQEEMTVQLSPAAVNLQTFEVSSRPLTAEEIIELVEDNFEKNYPRKTMKQNIYYHKFEKVPMSKDNKIKLKKSDFPGLDGQTLDKVMDLFPESFFDYHDARVEMYQTKENHKMIPQQAISLQEGSQEALSKEFEKTLGTFIEDFEKSVDNEEEYYKIRSGILSQKLENTEESDSIRAEYENDTSHFTVRTENIRREMISIIRDYTSVDHNNWEFINSPKRYKYTLEGVTLFNNEMVYQIRFTPEKKGVFEGTLYVSTSTYAVLQLDCQFAKDKSNEDFQLLGFGHEMKFKKAKVIFEKGADGYYVKYINAQEHETVSIERTVSLMKKRKRFLFDKELNKIKFKTDLFFESDSNWEILVLQREPISNTQFEAIKEPLMMKFQKNITYSKDMWKQGTVLAPSTELKNFKRQ